MTIFASNPKVRILGVTTKGPTELAPGLVPIAQALPGYEMPGWYGVLLPKGTPQNRVARIHDEFARVVNAPDMREKLIAAGAEPAMSTPPVAADAAPAFLTVEEAAEILRVNRKTLYEAIRLEQVPGVARIGKTLRIRRAALLEWTAGKGRDSALGSRK